MFVFVSSSKQRFNYRQMFSKIYQVHPLLQEYVQCIHVIDACIEDDTLSAACPYPPTPQNSLFFYVEDRIQVDFQNSGRFMLQPEAVVVGPQVTSVMIDVGRYHKAVRVGFHPGGLFRLTGLPLQELLDGSCDAEDLFGPVIRTVNQRLKEAGHPDELKQIVEHFLLRQCHILKPLLPFDRAMLVQQQQEGRLSIDAVASMACLSVRQLERVSKERLGYSPKLFSRIIRFSKAYRLREQGTQSSWTQIAYECGYFDQMHLIRDFRQFAGMAPGIIEKELRKAPVQLQKPLQF